MKRRTLQEKKQEQEKLLLEVCLEGAVTKEEKLKGYLEYEFITNCLEILKLQSLMGFGKKRTTGYLETQRLIENLLEQKMMDEYRLGLEDKVLINKSDINKVVFNFEISYKKSKGKIGNKRIHTDKFNCDADDEETAIILLKDRLKKLKEELCEILQINRQPSGVLMNDGGYHHIYSIDLIVK